MTRLLITLVAVIAIASTATACGFGEMTGEGKIAASADDYLRALADGDGRTACAQLTSAASDALEPSCPAEMATIAARIGDDALTAAADAGVEVDMDGSRASVAVRKLGARLTYVAVGDDWRSADGYSLEG